MAEIIADRVKQTTTSTGAGNITLTGIVVGFKTFSQVCQIGDTFNGCIVAVDSSGVPTGDWESGTFTYVATDTIARTVVRASSGTSGAAVVFGAGTKHVFIDLTAYQIKNFSTVNTNPSVKPAVPSGEETQYTSLTFADEFSGSVVDTAKWNTSGWALAPASTTQNYDINTGNLRVWPQRNGSGAWVSRSLTTKDKFAQRYGFFEFELQAPRGAGLYVHCGLANDARRIIKVGHMYSGAPAGGWSDNLLQAMDAFFSAETDYNGGSGNVADAGPLRIKDVMAAPNMSSAFHKLGVRWDATSIRFYFDGVQRGDSYAQNMFTTDMFLYVGLLMVTDNEYPPLAGTGSPSNSNPITPEGNTNSLKINYVRAWQIA